MTTGLVTLNVEPVLAPRLSTSTESEARAAADPLVKETGEEPLVTPLRPMVTTLTVPVTGVMLPREMRMRLLVVVCSACKPKADEPASIQAT